MHYFTDLSLYFKEIYKMQRTKNMTTWLCLSPRSCLQSTPGLFMWLAVGQIRPRGNLPVARPGMSSEKEEYREINQDCSIKNRTTLK